jgi:hypothetical protein
MKRDASDKYLQGRSEIDFIKKSERLWGAYQDSSEEIQVLCRKIIRECKQKLGNSRPVNLPQIRLAKEITKPMKRRTDEVYCIFELVLSKPNFIRINIRTDNFVEFPKTQLQPQESQMSSGLNWEAFRIYNDEDLEEALKLLKSAYQQYIPSYDR